ncbi:MAG TPA: SAM-dependent methyltransferase [Streptosporangiaceae bacterium]
MADSNATFEEHQRAWEELAEGIARLRDSVTDDPSRIAPPAAKGELLIIGSGIDSIGFSLGDEALIASADKVLYCVADPATVVWLRKLRPDALDLYVLYADDKVRYTTYMEMAEAQLYWVRQGLKVVVIFYGHPGIFVLSTHRAIQIARREGHRAVMRAGVSALDTLCADLGVDPSHPGLQTHEATDCLIRRRRIDTSLHVILWQVGLIGELGYRRQGYLNNHFSYFVSWLEELYGSGYEITHYIGARYPGTDPLIGVHRLRDLHDPELQREITGLSTFYIPPRDAIAMDRQTAVDLGILTQGQPVPEPGSPRRDVARYGKREMAAFSALARFRIPPSYHWQDDTEAARFLIELRFDQDLQQLYRRDPLAALDDPRFAGLSDRERGLLVSRDSGSVQIAAKGNYRRSIPNEETITRLLNDRASCEEIRATLRRSGRRRPDRRAALTNWLEARHLTVDWAMLASSLDFVYRNNLFPWTGVYTDPDSDRSVVIVGNRTVREKSAVYVDGSRIQRFRFSNGTLSWTAQGMPALGTGVPHGVLRLDLRSSAERRAVLKTWASGEEPGQGQTFVLPEADPARGVVAAHVMGTTDGRYALRRGGRFARTVFELTIGPDGVRIDGSPVPGALGAATLSWTGGPGPCAEGSITFVPEPVLGSVEFYGTVCSADDPGPVSCYGARLHDEPDNSKEQVLLASAEAQRGLAEIVRGARPVGGLLLWHKWEKASFTNMTVSKYLASLV